MKRSTFQHPVAQKSKAEHDFARQLSPAVAVDAPANRVRGRDAANASKKPVRPHFQGLTPEIAQPPSKKVMVQPKLMVGAPNDRYEQEADRVAAQVVQRLNTPQPLEPEAMEAELTVQRMPLVQRAGAMTGGMEASQEVTAGIQAVRGGGQPLDERVRVPMEQAFCGANFSGVRVHTDGRSAALNQAVGARAFTMGQDLFFKRGEYQPGNQGGQELIAHELTHVLQQGIGNENKAFLTSKLLPNKLQTTAQLSTAPSSTIQLKRYQVYRKLPLMVTGNKKDQSDALKKIKFALRQKYPGDTAEEKSAYQDELLDALKALSVEDESVSLRKAHVAEIDTTPRKRAGTQAKEIAKLEKDYKDLIEGDVKWIGAHLVKDAWGGEDNMWNVVAWPSETEDIWAQKFENPIDLAFQIGRTDIAEIEIGVTKEDEAWEQKAVHDALNEAISDIKTEKLLSDKEQAYAHQKLEQQRWKANRAVESVPETVTARSSYTPRFSFGPGDTLWNRARLLALISIAEEIDNVVKAVSKKEVHEQALLKAKTLEFTAETQEKRRKHERIKDDKEEYENLKPHKYENDLLD